MPSSDFASSPSMAMRRTISRALIPASTKTRVPLATSNTALPVEPLPSTEIFIGGILLQEGPQSRRDTEKFEKRNKAIARSLNYSVSLRLCGSFKFPDARDRRQTRSDFPARLLTAPEL